eukprot:c11957_g1_i1.p1 GENE.c11957_g1_i1~~c11957_g1_i1.p1  ORF type:complete len:425 (+),score=87.72 c11957_g1_i1:301-1575(+)
MRGVTYAQALSEAGPKYKLPAAAAARPAPRPPQPSAPSRPSPSPSPSSSSPEQSSSDSESSDSEGGVVANLPPFGLPQKVTVCLKPGTPRQETITAERRRATKYLRKGAKLGQCADALPAVAAGVPVDPSKGYFVGPVKPCASSTHCAYLITDGAYQMMIVTTGAGVIAIDAPPTIPNLLRAIAEVTSEPITHVIYTHSHADHIGGAGVYPSTATFIAHADTLAILQRQRPFPYGVFSGGALPPFPTQTFTDSLTLTVGSQTLELRISSLSHEAGSIFVRLPQDGILMFIDIVFPGWTMFRELAVSADVIGFIDAHDQILAIDFDVLVPGHVNKLGTRQDVILQKEYLLDILAAAQTAMSRVSFVDVGLIVGFQNLWLTFQTYVDTVGELCVDLVLAKWRGRLGAVDVFTRTHCDRLVESLRID